MRAGGEYFSGNPAKALELCRQASALVDPRQGLEDILQNDVVESFVAIAVDPGSLVAIQRRIDDRAARMADPGEIGFNLAVVRTLVAAARGDRKGMQASFAVAARSPGASRDFMHALALQLALVKHEDALARSWLADFDLDSAETTSDTLRLYIAWSKRSGDTAAAKRAQARLDAMRATALVALAKVPIAAP
jgi:hypothetical protein